MTNINAITEHAQICWVIPDIHATVKFLSNSLGIAFPKPEHVRAQDMNMTYYGNIVDGEWLTTQTYNGGTFIELVQPVSGQSMFHDYLAKYPAGGIQHNAFRLPVNGFEGVTDDLREQGYAVISEVDHPIARMAFFDTYKTLGVVTEIMGITPEGWKAIEQMQNVRWRKKALQNKYSKLKQGVNMSKVKVTAFSVSLDGYGAGPDQSRENPLGKRGEELHEWVFPTRMFQKMYGKGDGTEGTDNDFAEKSFENIGAWIMGRNMFGPIRGPWQDDEWKGWWGENPPYHVPVFVLTNHVRESVSMKGGTTFHFVTDGIESALEKARKAANGKDIRIGGGTSTIRQFLQAGYIDEMHLAFAPVFLGSGEHLFAGIDLSGLGFTVTQTMYGKGATHVILKKSK